MRNICLICIVIFSCFLAGCSEPRHAAINDKKVGYHVALDSKTTFRLYDVRDLTDDGYFRCSIFFEPKDSVKFNEAVAARRKMLVERLLKEIATSLHGAEYNYNYGRLFVTTTADAHMALEREIEAHRKRYGAIKPLEAEDVLGPEDAG